jgi:hypothetical protein
VNAGNLGPRESRKRLVFGLAMLAVGIGMAVALGASYTEAPLWWLLLFIPFWLAALNLLQAKEKT